MMQRNANPIQRLLVALITVLVAGAPVRGAAQAARESGAVDIGTVNKGGQILHRIAIPSFLSEQGSKVVAPGAFRDIIYKDLEISGVFQRAHGSVKGQDAIEAQHKHDRQSKGNPDFVEWRLLKADFLLVASYKLTDTELTVRAELWATDKDQHVFGKEYSQYKPKHWRVLAHRISDDIYFHLTNEQGVANTKILFVHGQPAPGGMIKEIAVMDADGEGQAQITRDRSLAVTPSWGFRDEQTGKQEIYFTSWKDYNPDLCSIDLDGRNARFIARWPTLNLSSSWIGGDTQRIALTMSKDGNSEIYTMDRFGKDLKRLTRIRAIDSSPSWFPNGRQLLFTSDRTGNPHIYMMDKDGINQQRLTYNGTYNDSAVLSPKADQIALTGRKNNVFNIYLVDLGGQGWRQLTGVDEPQGSNEDPSWSPNGRQLAFMSDRTGKQQIFIMNADGSNVRQLTDKGVNQSPAWSPFLLEK